jgi:hypothetical protein
MLFSWVDSRWLFDSSGLFGFSFSKTSFTSTHLTFSSHFKVVNGMLPFILHFLFSFVRFKKRMPTLRQ